jgi:hypothetical protein
MVDFKLAVAGYKGDLVSLQLEIFHTKRGKPRWVHTRLFRGRARPFTTAPLD